jgi:hypothetical protein
MSFPTWAEGMEGERGSQILLKKLIRSSGPQYYIPDGQGSLHATAQSKSSYLKILKVQD